ncbi:hypothetical protein JAAARDRAFT_31755 [Jaapia argillacea MUCL 33604]|uniref:Uncharacterized protein n=1 Tax=Jaapia argillacea MUCL 33604 TaxID=933084 RepID=A0A067QB91_9AGAM|nr:hypothetical protein JAAARDRAFT_31755 [Jaapia argillacea MUCL 33604]
MPTSTLQRSLRLFHSSARSCHLVGPPDPISHLRPVIYDDQPLTTPVDTRHPYSLREFAEQTHDDELHFKLHRQQTDVFNHRYWTDSNTRFEAAKQTVLDSLPSACTPKDRELALSEFYKQWLSQEGQRAADYSTEWRRRNFEGIKLAARVEYQRMQARIASVFTKSQQ